jgi:hypothetical protein
MICRFCSQLNRSVVRRCCFCSNLLDAEQDATAVDRATAPQPRLTLPPVQRDDFSGGFDPGRILSSQGTLLVLGGGIGLVIFITIIARISCATN